MTLNCFNRQDAATELCDNSHLIGIIEREDGIRIEHSLNEHLWGICGGRRFKFYMRFDFCPMCGEKIDWGDPRFL